MSLTLRFGSPPGHWVAAKPGGGGGVGSAATHSYCATLRARLEAEIEERIALLDALDGDPDFEPEPDEPSLGWTRTMAHGNTLDLEEKEVAP